MNAPVSTHDSAIRHPPSAIGHVTVEAVAWVTRFVGGDGTRRRTFEEAVAPGSTVRSVLVALSDRFPALRDALWDRAAGDLSEHVEVLVNEAVLGLTHTLDDPVRDGDRITLVGQYTGGTGPLGSRPATSDPSSPEDGGVRLVVRSDVTRSPSAMALHAVPATKLLREFYLRPDVLAVARDLLGCLLVVPARNGRRVSGVIVETEAYRGPEDRASHAYGGRRTRRTETMYQIGGTAYVYFVYGMYHQFNVVTNGCEIPHAVLVRALEPSEGIEWMRERRPDRSDADLASGPGKLCLALGIDRGLDGADLLGKRAWIEPRTRPVATSSIACGARIGIDYAGEWVEKPWRFWLRGSPFVSRSDGGARRPKQ